MLNSQITKKKDTSPHTMRDKCFSVRVLVLAACDANYNDAEMIDLASYS